MFRIMLCNPGLDLAQCDHPHPRGSKFRWGDQDSSQPGHGMVDLANAAIRLEPQKVLKPPVGSDCSFVVPCLGCVRWG